MKVWLFPVMLAAFLAAGCAAGEPFQHFPRRNADARIGQVENEGTTHLNLWVSDQAGRLIEEWYLAPAKDPLAPLAVNQQRSPTLVLKALPPGSYQVTYIPFYYTWSIFQGRQRVDLPRGSASIWVSRDPNAVYDHRTGRHWGWMLRLHGGDMPRDPLLQNVNFSIRCC